MRQRTIANTLTVYMLYRRTAWTWRGETRERVG